MAAQHQVKAVVGVAGAGPFALTRLDRALQWYFRRAQREIEHRRRAAIERGAADLARRRAHDLLVATRQQDRHAAMDVRVDAAGHDDLARGVDDPAGTDCGEAARRPD